jgi:hypothetical protein
LNPPGPYGLPSNTRVTTSHATSRPNIPATVTSSQAFPRASVNSTNPLPHPLPSNQPKSNLQPRPPTAQPTVVPQSSLHVRQNYSGF